MKSEKFKRAAAIALAVMVCAASLTACGNAGRKPKDGAGTTKQSERTIPRRSDKKDSQKSGKSAMSAKKDASKVEIGQNPADPADKGAAKDGADKAAKDTVKKDAGKD